MAKSVVRWPPVELQQIETVLAQLRSDLEEALRDDNPHVNWLAQLLVVKSAGYVEQAALLSARSHLSTLAVGTVRSYGLARVERYFGPKPDGLFQFVQRFDKEWANELEDLLAGDGDKLKLALKALLGARDQIAHGKSNSVGPVMALEYAECAERIASWLILRLNPL